MSTDSQPAVAFSEQALAEYHEILTHYPVRRAALMPVLWLAQREFGWLSKDVQAYVAGLMELPMAWLESIVDFYTMYYTRPMGRHHIQVCTNLSCRLRGADNIVSALRRRLGVEPGEITADGKFSLDTVECLGSCGTAPMLQLGSRFVENLSVKTTLELIDGLEN
ncbi:MAG: NAD(P)H-dependent oxidoreductase subunit E [Deltaproteobacteria bacterium]